MKQNRRKWIATQSWSSPKYSNHQKSERKSFHEDQWIGLRENLQESPIENNGKIWENRWFPVPIFPNKPIHWEDPWSRAIRTHAQKDCAVHSSSLEFTRVHSSSLHTRFSVPNDNVKAHIGEESHQTWERAESILECCASIYQPFSCKRRFFFGGETKIKNQNMVDIYIYILYYIYIIYYVIWIYLLPLYPHMVGFCWCFKSLYIVIS